jgi:hypothetical protein
MPRKKTTVPVDAGLPDIPKELLDQFVTGPMTAEAEMSEPPRFPGQFMSSC